MKTPTQAPSAAPPHVLPQEGGSFILGSDGKPIREDAPADPVPAEPAQPEEH